MLILFWFLIFQSVYVWVLSLVNGIINTILAIFKCVVGNLVDSKALVMDSKYQVRYILTFLATFTQLSISTISILVHIALGLPGDIEWN